MAINPNEDTEFNDALRKHGILPPLPSSPPRSPSPTAASTDLDDLLDAELDALLDDDQGDDQTHRHIEDIQRSRAKEDRKQWRFGRVYPIGREDYTREVTDASLVNEKDDDDDGEGEEKGTGVVCLLYKDGIPRSEKTVENIRVLAQRYPRTKFVSIVGEKCIENLPDSRIPMIIMYKKGEIREQVVRWDKSLQDLEVLLLISGVLHPPVKGKEEEDEGDSDADEKKKSDDEEFEFDL